YSSRRRHTRSKRDWSSDVCSSDLKLILASHLGRPKGKPVASMTLRPAAERLAKLVRKPVAFANDCVGPEVEAQAQGLGAGGVLLDRKGTRLNSSHVSNSYAVFCLKKNRLLDMQPR